VDKVRNRLVNFRVTDEEFRYLKAATAVQKARCLSDFARSVVLRMAAESASDGNGTPEERMGAFDRRLAQVESIVAEIVAALVKSKAMTLKPPD
jgi:hypothetical protein